MLSFTSCRNYFYRRDYGTNCFSIVDAPALNARVTYENLDKKFSQRWIGTNGSLGWSARSPDNTPLNFFLWGQLKSEIYDRQPECVEELQDKITESCKRIPRNVVQTVTRKHRKIICKDILHKKVNNLNICTEISFFKFPFS